MNEEPDAFVKAVHGGIIAAQMVAKSAQAIVREMIVDVAKLHPDPERYLADLFARVAVHAEPRPADFGKPEKEAQSQARFAVEAIFRDASVRLKNERPGRPPNDAHQKP